MSADPGRLARRIFALLLRVYPPGFRARYGPEMEELFLRRLGEARSGAGARTLRMAALAWDMLRQGAGLRMQDDHDAFRARGTAGGDDRRGHPTGWLREGWDAARRLARSPAFALVAVALIGVGMGLNLAVFTVLDGVLLQPPPYGEPDRLVAVYQHGDDGTPSSSSFPAATEMAERADVFAGVTATSPDVVTWERPAGPRQASAEYVTANHFPVLRMPLTAGPGFEPRHDRPGAGLYAVVNHRTWEREMGADPGVIGRTVRLNGHPVTVVGIGPEGYAGILGAVVTDFWLSISSTEVGGPFRVANLERRQDHWYDVRARLAPGVSVEQARAAMDALAASLAERFPEVNEGRGISVFPSDEVRIHPEADANTLPVAAALVAIAGLVLVLVVSNLANLLLARGLARGSEVAVRRALGASRGRIARLFLAEALLLSTAGGLLAVLLARWSLSLVPRLPLPVPGALDLAIDGRSLLFAGVLVLLTAVLFGTAPALRAAGWDVAGALREGGARATPGRTSSGPGRLLVAAQVAVSVVLLAGALFLARDLAKLRSVDVGVDADRIAWLGTNLRADPAADRIRLEELRAAAEAIPGVTRATVASHLPVQFGGTSTTVVEGYEPAGGGPGVELRVVVVGPDYFRTMGVAVLAGRGFDRNARPDEPTEVVVSEAFARRYWGTVDPTGRRIRREAEPDGWMEVVGVVGNVRATRLREPPSPMYYLSAAQVGLNTAHVLARTEGEPASLVTPLRRARERVAPGLPLDGLGTLRDHVDATLAVPRLAAGLLGAFALLALLLAWCGVYAVVSFTVARRRSEMGIRMALGSGRLRMVRGVLGPMAGTLLAGLAVGALGAVLVVRLLSVLLTSTPGAPLATVVLATAVLALAGAAAAGVPAVRAARTDPARVLRAE